MARSGATRPARSSWEARCRRAAEQPERRSFRSKLHGRPDRSGARKGGILRTTPIPGVQPPSRAGSLSSSRYRAEDIRERARRLSEVERDEEIFAVGRSREIPPKACVQQIVEPTDAEAS